MKRLILIFLSVFSLQSLSAQDYNLVFGPINSTHSFWNGTYTQEIFDFPSEFNSPNFLSIGRVVNGSPLGGTSSVIGQGGLVSFMNFPICGPLPPAFDLSNESIIEGGLDGGGPASLPDGKCVLISNEHPSLNVFIKYWDDGDGAFDFSGYPFACNGTGVPDYTLGPGEEVILQRQGNIIEAVMSCAAPIPTLQEWGLIILAFSCLIFGIMSIKATTVVEA